MEQLQPIDLVAPGFQGLNTEQSQALIDPTWATLANNCVLDASGRLASRGGWTSLTGTEITSSKEVKSVHEQITANGTRSLIVAWDGGIADDIDNPEANDVSAAVTDTSGVWNFQNFFNEVIGFQDGQKPITRTSGNFATVTETSGTAPTIADGVGFCGYGRIWGLDSDKQTIKYCALLDSAHWATGAGSIDMSNIWTAGSDQVTAIVGFNGYLIVFGHRHIVVFEDPQGTILGVDPSSLVVRDVYDNVGCVGWSAIQPIGDADLMFVGRNGVQSLGRVIQEKSANIATLTTKVHGEFMKDFSAVADHTEISTVVDPERGYFIVSIHDATDRTWVFHYTRPFRDDRTGAILFPITTWGMSAACWEWDTSNQRLIFGYAGGVALYGSGTSDNGTVFLMEYESPYFSMEEQLANRLKILKRMGTIIFVQAATNVTVRWDFDFKNAFQSKVLNFTSATSAEWNLAEWGLDEWSGAAALRIRKFPASGKGQYIKVGLSVEVASQVAIQQMEVFTKIGRFA